MDEGIVVTNRHVVERGDWYRVYATGDNEEVNLDCFRKIQKSDVKLNLENDVAYMRAYLPCDHGMLNFADDPQNGDLISVLGYPFRNTEEESLRLAVMTGAVIGRTTDGWISTDAFLDVGISGGAVVNDTGVVGVAVAKGVDDEGNYVEGFFIPSSVIESGLLYANNSDFGYVPRSRSSVARSSVRSSSSARSSVSSASSRSSRSASSASRSASSASSRRSPIRILFPDVPPSRAGYVAILSLYDEGVIGGYPDGTFRPDAGINRAELIKILVEGFYEDAARGESNCFTDVASQWFATYVCAAKRLGWIDGYADGSFRPAQKVNRAEAMKILTGAFAAPSASTDRMPSDVRSGTWFYQYVARGVELGIIDPRVRFHPERELNREDAAIWIYKTTD